jgi:hypothetical protein
MIGHGNFMYLFLYCAGWGYIYKGSYKVSNIPYLNSPSASLSETAFLNYKHKSGINAVKKKVIRIVRIKNKIFIRCT